MVGRQIRGLCLLIYLAACSAPPEATIALGARGEAPLDLRFLGVWTLIMPDRPDPVIFAHLEITLGQGGTHFDVRFVLSDDVLRDDELGPGREVFRGEAHANALDGAIVYSVLRTGGIISPSKAPAGFSFYRARLDESELLLCPFFALVERNSDPKSSMLSALGSTQLYSFRVGVAGGYLEQIEFSKEGLVAVLRDLPWSEGNCAKPLRLSSYPIWN